MNSSTRRGQIAILLLSLVIGGLFAGKDCTSAQAAREHVEITLINNGPTLALESRDADSRRLARLNWPILKHFHFQTGFFFPFPPEQIRLGARATFMACGKGDELRVAVRYGSPTKSFRGETIRRHVAINATAKQGHQPVISAQASNLNVRTSVEYANYNGRLVATVTVD